ncbi:MAG TPA: hypothetical protein VMG12_08965 [Polyangiaceae bacterium]|nr:hypothetical protein [Polyangiaceae bacterium]
MSARSGVGCALASLAVSVFAASAGCQSDFGRDDLDGRPCPCLPDWECDTSRGASGVCVLKSAGLGGSGGVDSGDAGGGASGAGAGGGSSDDAGTGGARAGDAGNTGGAGGDGCSAAATPTGGACPAVCDECTNGTCFIRCDGARACSSTSLACPAGFHCEVSCSSDDNCVALQLACSGEHSCTTRCTGKRSCRTLDMACASGPCALECASGAQICRGSELHCGTGRCQASCGGNETPVVSGCEASCSADCGC